MSASQTLNPVLAKRLMSDFSNNRRVYPKELQEFHKAIANDARFVGMEVEKIESLAKAIGAQPLTDIQKSVDTLHSMATRGSALDSLLKPTEKNAEKVAAQLKAEVNAETKAAKQVKELNALADAPVIAQSATHVADKKVSWVKSLSQRMEMLSTEQKLNAGMWFAGAGLGALGVWGAAKDAIGKDEQGNNQVQWTQAGVALIKACLAAGCAYMGAQALRGVAR